MTSLPSEQPVAITTGAGRGFGLVDTDIAKKVHSVAIRANYADRLNLHV